MMKLPVGVIIKSIIDEKRIKVADIADKLGSTRQAIYQSYAKQEMSDSELTRWSTALGVEKEFILERWDNTTISTGPKLPEENSYLMEHLSNLESQFKRLLDIIETNNRQIDVKDRQIEGLQKTVDVLLGKSRDVSILMATLAAPNQSKSSAAMA